MPREVILRALAAAASGVLWALCFPKPDLGFLAWLALVPLFWAISREEQWARAGLLAYLSGTVFYLALMQWIYTTCRTAGLSAPLAAGAWIGLAVLMAGHWALFGAGIGAYRRIFERVPAPVWAALWVGVEWLSVRATTRFPWGLAGYTQWRSEALLPTAGVLGVYGLSFLVISANAALASVLAEGRRSLVSVVSTAVLVAGFLFLGKRLGPPALVPPAETRISILQADIDQYKKWDDEFEKEILSTYAELALASRDSVLVVWPESAVPGWLEDKRHFDWVSKLVEATGTFHLIGIVSKNGRDARNSAALFGPEGQLLGAYHKRQLVPFGEEIPLKSVLGSRIPVLGALGDFTPGPPEQVPLRVFWAEFGLGICYEAVFPHLMRHRGTEDARVLVNLTNDGWYLDTAGPYQHFAMSVLRAAENRTYLVRAANTGISALVDPWGKVVAQTRIGEKTALEVKLAEPLARSAPSFFALYGEVFPALCLGGCVAMLPLGALEKRANRIAKEQADAQAEVEG